MNVPHREIPIIDLWTGLPWVADAENLPSDDAPDAADASDMNRSRAERRTSDDSGPQIAPHRQMDAAAIDLADVRGQRRCRCPRRDR